MKIMTTLGFVAVGLLWTQAQTDDSKTAKADADRLIGTYSIVSGEKNGQKIAADQLRDVKVRIAENAITTLAKDKKEVYAATYEIDTAQKPWRIMMTATITPVDGKGTKSEGLIAMDGDTVKLIYALPGGKPPTDFKTGDQQQMFVIRKTGK